MVETITKTDWQVGAQLMPITDFAEAMAFRTTGARLAEMRQAAARFHDRFRNGARVRAVRTFDLIRFPYPTQFGLFRAALSPAPYVMMTNRTLLVQFLQQGELKTLLMNPT